MRTPQTVYNETFSILWGNNIFTFYDDLFGDTLWVFINICKRINPAQLEAMHHIAVYASSYESLQMNSAQGAAPKPKYLGSISCFPNKLVVSLRSVRYRRR